VVETDGAREVSDDEMTRSRVERVEFNAPPDTISVISEAEKVESVILLL